jgi:ankyrin repeat protein
MKNEEINKNENEQAFLIICKMGKPDSDNSDLVDYYINKKVDVNCKDSDGNTPLHFAAKNNNKIVFEKLINAGAKTDIRNNEGERAIDISLLKCCEENNEKSVLELIGIGADVNCKDSEDKRPLDYLIRAPEGQDIKKVATLLIENGAITTKERLNRFERPGTSIRLSTTEYLRAQDPTTKGR